MSQYPVSAASSAVQGFRYQASADIPIASFDGDSQVGAASLEAQNVTSNPLGGNNNQPAHHNSGLELSLEALTQRLEWLEKCLPSNSPPGASIVEAELTRRQSGLQHSQIMLNKTRIVSVSHWNTFVQEFNPILACYDQAFNNAEAPAFQDSETRAVIVQMGDLLHTAKRLTKQIKTVRPSGSLADPDFGLVNPVREVADQMVNLYFESFESTHRILHIPTFWIEYKDYWDHPDNAPTPLRLKVLLVIGIGSSLSEENNPDAEIRIMVHQWVHAAQTWLSGPLKKDRLDLNGLQIYCLTILLRQLYSIGGDLVWMSMGSLVHRAMQIGLHRDPKHLPPMSALQAELRRRLWATILELLAQSALDAGMPPRMSLDEFDTEAPANVNDDEINESVMSPKSHPKNDYTSTSIQLQILESLPLRLRILQLLSGLHSEISYLDVLTLTTQVMTACQKSDGFLKENERSGVTMFHRNLLDFSTRRFLLVLHCPFAFQARDNPLFHYSLKTSIDAAMAILSPPPDERFSRLLKFSGGMFREAFRCAGNIVSHELLVRVQAQIQDGALHRKAHDIDYLKKAVHGMIEFSIERIRLGETNIKGHMFLCQIKAQIEAMEAGEPYEYIIAQNGRDSLQLCVGVLQKRVDALPLPYPDGIGFTPTEISEQDSFGLNFGLDFFSGGADVM
ncbi:hypothetical protein AB5N19_11590 [Seiridium cardinale]